MLISNSLKQSVSKSLKFGPKLTFCSFHRIEQNICLVGTSINKGCAVYYYSVTHGLRINR